MAYNFENQMLDLTSKKRELLISGEHLLKQKRIDIGVDECYDMVALENAEFRMKASSVLFEYQKQLLVEKEFYSEFHRTFVEEVKELALELKPDESSRVLARSLPGLEENNSIRMKMNLVKCNQNIKIARVVEIYNLNDVSDSDRSIELENDEDVGELNQIFSDLDAMSKELASLSRTQIKRGVEGKKFVQRFLEVLRKNA